MSCWICHPERSEGSPAAAVLGETKLGGDHERKILHFVQNDTEFDAWELLHTFDGKGVEFETLRSLAGLSRLHPTSKKSSEAIFAFLECTPWQQ